MYGTLERWLRCCKESELYFSNNDCTTLNPSLTLSVGKTTNEVEQTGNITICNDCRNDVDSLEKTPISGNIELG